jgi:hypothetical protein
LGWLGRSELEWSTGVMEPALVLYAVSCYRIIRITKKEKLLRTLNSTIPFLGQGVGVLEY